MSTLREIKVFIYGEKEIFDLLGIDVEGYDDVEIKFEDDELSVRLEKEEGD